MTKLLRIVLALAIAATATATPFSTDDTLTAGRDVPARAQFLGRRESEARCGPSGQCYSFIKHCTYRLCTIGPKTCRKGGECAYEHYCDAHDGLAGPPATRFITRGLGTTSQNSHINAVSRYEEANNRFAASEARYHEAIFRFVEGRATHEEVMSLYEEYTADWEESHARYSEAFPYVKGENYQASAKAHEAEIEARPPNPQDELKTRSGNDMSQGISQTPGYHQCDDWLLMVRGTVGSAFVKMDL
ncbi:hypothetical protein N0V90_011532 [Kalmusia sp. IMI 367209]|nr:hypothetical protein N0V90_011532 [Kalmusia sp. IMI 367209]